jgi:hypothetical protein
MLFPGVPKRNTLVKLAPVAAEVKYSSGIQPPPVSCEDSTFTPGIETPDEELSMPG